MASTTEFSRFPQLERMIGPTTIVTLKEQVFSTDPEQEPSPWLLVIPDQFGNCIRQTEKRERGGSGGLKRAFRSTYLFDLGWVVSEEALCHRDGTFNLRSFLSPLLGSPYPGKALSFEELHSESLDEAVTDSNSLSLFVWGPNKASLFGFGLLSEGQVVLTNSRHPSEEDLLFKVPVKAINRNAKRLSYGPHYSIQFSVGEDTILMGSCQLWGLQFLLTEEGDPMAWVTFRAQSYNINAPSLPESYLAGSLQYAADHDQDDELDAMLENLRD